MKINIHNNNIWIYLVSWLTLQFKPNVLNIGAFLGRKCTLSKNQVFGQGIHPTSVQPNKCSSQLQSKCEDDGKVAAFDDEGGQRPFSDIDPNPEHICDNV